MLVGRVVGIKHVSYTSKKTGAPVQGIQLNMLYPQKGTDGEEVGTVYVSASGPEYEEVTTVKIGDSIRFVTSFQYGRYTNVYVGKEKK